MQSALKGGTGWLFDIGLVRAGRALERLERRLYTLDYCTGLLHRVAWIRAYEKLAPNAGAVLLVDLDHLKRVNDRFYYLEGDRALEQIARLVEQQATGCLVGRLGGDEFVVLVPSPGEALAVAERIRAAAEKEPRFEALRGRMGPGSPHVLTVSVGVTMVGTGDALTEVLHRADGALQGAKLRGRNCVERYRPDA